MKDLIINRRSIRKYTNYKISKEELTKIIDESLKAPSSNNLQPLKLLVIDSDEAKRTLKKIMPMNQLQLETSSQLVLIFGDTLKYERAEELFKLAHEAGKMPLELIERHLTKFRSQQIDPTDAKHIASLHLDAGLFAMNFMTLARYYGYDTCAIGGFNKDLANEAFKIDSRYVPILLISIGKKDDEGYDSYRLPASIVADFI